MLNEKKVIVDKLTVLIFFTLAAGFMLGIGGCLLIVVFGLDKSLAGLGVAGVFVVVSFIFAFAADKLRKQIKEYIMSPYVKMEDKDDDKDFTILDPSAN